MPKNSKAPKTIRVKTPTTMRELGNLTGRLDLPIMDTWKLIDGALGKDWWKHSLGELTFTLAPVRVTAVVPPAGYTLAPGCSDRWIGTEIISRRWIITPAWDATTNSHSLEVWMADHTPPTYGNLTPEEARELGAALIQAAQAADSV